ncbi:MAG: hypothetical protein NQU46_07295 [Methanolinea sp.]|nr:hypothetical protein [Methanolinea sp.]
MKRILLALLISSFLVLPATPVLITAHPETIANGQPVYVRIRDLPDGAHFSLLVEASYGVSPNSEFWFQMSHFGMPFSLTQGSMTATLTGTSQNRLEVKKEDTIVSISGKSIEGRFTTTKSYDITAGTYDYFRLSGITDPTARSIFTQFQVTGVKKGPSDSEITFVVDGLPSGSVTIAALVNGSQVMYRTIPVGTGDAAPASSSPAAPVSSTSPDGLVRVTVPAGSPVSIVKVAAPGIPAGMQVVAGPYALVPGDVVFRPEGQIAFTHPGGMPGDGATVAFFSNGTWTLLPSVTTPGDVTAPLAGGGIYALLAPVPTSPTTLLSLPPTLLTPAPGTATTPLATPSPRAGLPPLVILSAIAAGMVALVMKRTR